MSKYSKSKKKIVSPVQPLPFSISKDIYGKVGEKEGHLLYGLYGQIKRVCQNVKLEVENWNKQKAYKRTFARQIEKKEKQIWKIKIQVRDSIYQTKANIAEREKIVAELDQKIRGKIGTYQKELLGITYVMLNKEVATIEILKDQKDSLIKRYNHLGKITNSLSILREVVHRQGQMNGNHKHVCEINTLITEGAVQDFIKSALGKLE